MEEHLIFLISSILRSLFCQHTKKRHEEKYKRMEPFFDAKEKNAQREEQRRRQGGKCHKEKKKLNRERDSKCFSHRTIKTWLSMCQEEEEILRGSAVLWRRGREISRCVSNMLRVSLGCLVGLSEAEPGSSLNPLQSGSCSRRPRWSAQGVTFTNCPEVQIYWLE